MKERIKGFFLGLYSIFAAFMFGLKRANDEAFGQVDNGTGTEIGSVKDITQHRISMDLLNAEETQEVQELRYRTYKVDREAKQYDVYSPMKAFKRKDHGKGSKKIKYDNPDNLKLITIQENYAVTESVEDGLKQVEEGVYGKSTEYWIKIKRDFLPRFALEKFVTKLAVLDLNDNGKVRLDFYVHKYPKQFDIVSRPFIREVKEIMENGVRSDVIRFDGVSFNTLNAWGLDDMLWFDFEHIRFKEVVEYDGHYILRFNASVRINGYDLTEPYYSKTMDEKYKNKEKKEGLTINFNGKPDTREYICEVCGKKVVYDTDEIDNMPVNAPRDITDPDDEGTKTNALSYYDAEIAAQTFGKWMCADCIRKHYDKLTKDVAKEIDREKENGGYKHSKRRKK